MSRSSCAGVNRVGSRISTRQHGRSVAPWYYAPEMLSDRRPRFPACHSLAFRPFQLPSASNLCSTFEAQQSVVLGVLWELVVNPSALVKVSAAVIFKAMVSHRPGFKVPVNIPQGLLGSISLVL